MTENRFDAKYDIRMASYNEIEEVMQYIDLNWKKQHILSANREFFEYEHVIDKKVNFLIAKNRKSGEIEGILGFLPASRDNGKLDIWGVVWKVSENAMPMLGIELKKRLVMCTGARAEMGVGCNPKTSIPLLKRLLKYHVGKMKQYYILSPKEEYKIAKVNNWPSNSIRKAKTSKIEIKLCECIDELAGISLWDEISNAIPYKDAWYVDRRYFNHPIYSYQVYSLLEQEIVKAIIVLRVDQHCGALALRVVDYIGEHRLFGELSDFFREKLPEVEYIDFYSYGFEEEYIIEAGMVERKEDDTNIIPNYFSPFEQRNIDIWVASSKEGVVLFKADGDQDRPN